MLSGIQIINHKKFQDHRGDFCELWKISNDNMRGSFRQLNCATSCQHVIRGMHRQDQTKLVMPIYGEIYDVALDPVTGEWFGTVLNPERGMLIPPQYAHGYLVLSELSIVQYIVDAPYNKSLEENFHWNQYGIQWPLSKPPILSNKDE